MIPILYKAAERTFETNGLGRLSDAVECTVTEERNGQYELQMTYPVTGAHYDDLAEERIILAKPSDGANDQPFEIYSIGEPLNGLVTVRARHISYQLKELVVKPFKAASPTLAMQSIEASIVGEHPFTFWTNKTTPGAMEQLVPVSCRALLGGMEGSVLDAFGGGEYEFDRFSVRLWEARGKDRGVTVRYGKNLTDYTGERDVDGVYTSVVPYWQGQDADGAESVIVGGKVESGHVGEYSCQKCVPLDLSEEFETPPTKEQLEERARAYMESNAPWQKKVAIKVSFLPLEKTLEYADVSALEHVQLCDTITVEYRKPVKAKVIKTVYNVLREVYISLEIGDARTTFAQTVTNDTPTRQEVGKKVNSAVQQASARMNALVQNASGLYSTAQVQPDGSTIYYLHDKKTMGQSQLVMKLTAEAIGFSTDGGRSYPYGFTVTGEMVMQIISAAGLDAGWIRTGELNAQLIKAGILRSDDGETFYLDLDKGVLKMKASSLSIGGKTVDKIAEDKAKGAVNGQTQEDIFNKLTENGTLPGIYMEDGQLYINVNYLGAGVIDLGILKLAGTICGLMQGNGATKDGETTQGIVLYGNGVDANGNANPPYAIVTSAGFRVQLTSDYYFDFSGGALGVNGNVVAKASGNQGGEIFADGNLRLGRYKPDGSHGVSAYIDGSTDRYMIYRNNSQGSVNVGNSEDDTYVRGNAIRVGRYQSDLAECYWKDMTDAGGNTYTVLTKA